MNTIEKYKQLEIIAKIIADKSDKTPEFIFLDTRVRQIADLRATFFYFAKRYSPLSLDDIGKFSLHMGRGKQHDHATVLYNIKKVKEIMSIDKEFSQYIGELENEIRYYVDYDRYWYDEKAMLKKEIVTKIYSIEDMEIVCDLNKVVNIIYENNDILSILAVNAQNELNKKQERIENEGIHQTTSEDIGLGVV